MTLEISNYWDDFPERLTETVEALKNNTTPKLTRLTIHVTESCNLQCKYCNTNQKIKNIDEELLYKIIYEYVHIGGKVIHFTGGEPTIYPHIDKAITLAKVMGLKVSLNTNAVHQLPTYALVNKIKASFDTCDSELCRYMCGSDVFERVHKNLTLYSKSLGGTLSLTALVSKLTYKSIFETAKWAVENYNPYNIYFTAYKGSAPEYIMNTEDVTELFEVHIPNTLKYFDSVGQEYSAKQLRQYTRKDFIGIRFPENNSTPCTIQLSEMTIDTDGNCHNCSHLFRDHVSKGGVNVKDTGVLGAFNVLKSVRQTVPVSPCCLTGCNPNLVAFNRAVEKEFK